MTNKDFTESISENLIHLQQTSSASLDADSLPSAVKTRKRTIDEKLVVFSQVRSVYTEYFHNLAFRLERILPQPAEKGKGKVILFTGPTQGSGKTICALNLSLALARSFGREVLFLDADCRNSHAQTYLGYGNIRMPGLADYLLQGTRAGSILQNTGLFDLAYLPAGEFKEELLERFQSPEFLLLLKNLREKFRYVIIDSPPSFPMPEAGIISLACDGVLIVLHAGRDGEEQLQQALQSLEGSNILGVILNDLRSSPTRKYHYGRYHYTR